MAFRKVHEINPKTSKYNIFKRGKALVLHVLPKFASDHKYLRSHEKS